MTNITKHYIRPTPGDITECVRVTAEATEHYAEAIADNVAKDGDVMSVSVELHITAHVLKQKTQKPEAKP